jgi:membrane associated rhomboid family serine protease
MFVPLNTDAPLYHFPWGTIGLVVVNTACCVLSNAIFDDSALTHWALEFGNGINPLEWFTAAFYHDSLIHLIGNMFFLWGCGLVVEGKLGWKRFLPLYLLVVAIFGAGIDLATLHRTPQYVLRQLGVQTQEEFVARLQEQDAQLVEKLVAQNIDGDALRALDEQPELWPTAAEAIVSRLQGRCVGASGAIYALMGMALIWAPKNELYVVGLLGLRLLSFDISILMFSLCFIGLDMLSWLIDPGMSSAGMQLTGLVPGLVIGTWLLKSGRVDCENWDLFAVLSGKYGRFADSNWNVGAHSSHLQQTYGDLPLPQNAGTDEVPAVNKKTARGKVPATVLELIDKGDYLTAADELFELRIQHADTCPDEDRTRKLAIGLCRAEAWDHAEIWLNEFICRFPEDNRWARIRLAELLLQQSRPRAALRQLNGLKTEGLNPQLLKQARKILQEGRTQIEQGIRDAEPEWGG